jgi:hypothetical protein
VVVCEETWEVIDTQGNTPTKTARRAWLPRHPLCRDNAHERCNLGAPYRWGIEANFLVEKHQGYHYEHAFALNWKAMKGYQSLMHLAHLFNALARFTRHLRDLYRELGVRGPVPSSAPPARRPGATQSACAYCSPSRSSFSSNNPGLARLPARASTRAGYPLPGDFAAPLGRPKRPPTRPPPPGTPAATAASAPPSHVEAGARAHQNRGHPMTAGPQVHASGLGFPQTARISGLASLQ